MSVCILSWLGRSPGGAQKGVGVLEEVVMLCSWLSAYVITSKPCGIHRKFHEVKFDDGRFLGEQ